LRGGREPAARRRRPGGEAGQGEEGRPRGGRGALPDRLRPAADEGRAGEGGRLRREAAEPAAGARRRAVRYPELAGVHVQPLPGAAPREREGGEGRLDFIGRARRPGDGLRRRTFLQVGSLAIGGLSLPWLLRHRAAASAAPKARRSVILVWLAGGPS